MSLRWIAVAVLFACACREASSSSDGKRAVATAEPPCAGCTLDVPARRGAKPLIVVLHGDHERAQAAAARAIERGWALLALQCPREKGCAEDNSWYKWRGAPTWVRTQVGKVARTVEIDPRRTYLIGWSGGATYIGMNAPSWTRDFAAVVFHGGGQPPSDVGEGHACPSRDLPAYFLVGDRNAAHAAAKRLRAYLERCGEDVQWDLIGGADHAEEDAALDRGKASKILDWLEERPRDDEVSVHRTCNDASSSECALPLPV
jgi:poly(3-hydroxybutyrate) depolymerase